MFLAFPRRHLLSCAKGHVARISGAAQSYAHVREWNRSPSVCRQTCQLTPATTDTKHLQRLNVNFSCSRHRPDCVHFVEKVVAPAFPTRFINKLTARTNQSPVNRPNVTIFNWQVHKLGGVWGDGVSVGLHSRLKGLKGYCTEPGKPAQKEDQKVLGQEISGCASSSSSSSTSNEVQFKELVRKKKPKRFKSSQYCFIV